jgi:hypothetical protein
MGHTSKVSGLLGLMHEDTAPAWPSALAGGIDGGVNRRIGGGELVISPSHTMLGLRVSLEEWQSEAPTTWYHGSPAPGLTYLDPNRPKAHTPFIQVWGVYLSRYIETARVFGRYVYRVRIPDTDHLVPDPDIQELTKGDYLAVVYQGEIFDVTQITDPNDLIVNA